MAIQAHVLHCTAFDEVTKECTAQTWLPAPYLLPPLEPSAALEILAACAVLLCVAWGWKQLGRTTRN